MGDLAEQTSNVASNMPSNAVYILIVAHPDDESLFFVPTIQYLVAQQADVWLLCLTTGNHDGLGTVRSRELQNACHYLGISKVLLVNDAQLPDHPTHAWPTTHAAHCIRTTLQREKRMDKKDTDVIILTFDDYGVSGHSNHRDTFRAVQQWCEQPNSIVSELWVLESVHNPFRKYIPLPEWILWLWNWMMSGPKQHHQSSTTIRQEEEGAHRYYCFRWHAPWHNWHAMALHHSQFVWYRRVFVVCSCYTYCNTWKVLIQSKRA